MTSPIKVGIIGANLSGGLGGSWGVAAHLPALLANSAFDVVAVATTQMETARATADRFEIRNAYGSAQEMVRDQEIDLVTVCTRVGTHRSLIELVLDTGKHVFCEWPLGASLKEAQSIAAKARAAGVRTMIGLQTRQAPAFAKARELIALGAIGNVEACQVMHSGPWSTLMPRANAYFQLDEGGGNFTTIRGGHTLDALCSLVGPVAEVSAVGQTVCPTVRILETGEEYERTCWDQLSIVGHASSGAMISLQLHGGPGASAGIRVEVAGSKGSLLIEGPPQRGIQMAELTLATLASDGSRTLVALEDEVFPGNAMIGNVVRGYDQFAHAIREGFEMDPGFEEALRLHRLINAIAQSASERKQVSVV